MSRAVYSDLTVPISRYLVQAGLNVCVVFSPFGIRLGDRVDPLFVRFWINFKFGNTASDATTFLSVKMLSLKLGVETQKYAIYGCSTSTDPTAQTPSQLGFG